MFQADEIRHLLQKQIQNYEKSLELSEWGAGGFCWGWGVSSLWIKKCHDV